MVRRGQELYFQQLTDHAIEETARMVGALSIAHNDNILRSAGRRQSETLEVADLYDEALSTSPAEVITLESMTRVRP